MLGSQKLMILSVMLFMPMLPVISSLRLISEEQRHSSTDSRVTGCSRLKTPEQRAHLQSPEQVLRWRCCHWLQEGWACQRRTPAHQVLMVSVPHPQNVTKGLLKLDKAPRNRSEKALLAQPFKGQLLDAWPTPRRPSSPFALLVLP